MSPPARVNLGQQGPAPIKGFRQAARVYFRKDLNQLDLAQCALLAGMIQSPRTLTTHTATRTAPPTVATSF